MNNNHGFTLVEVLATIVILGIIILSFFQFFIFSQKTTTNNQDKLVAINVAQKVLEQIKEEAGEPDSTAQKSQYWLVTHPADYIYVKTYGGESHQETVNGKTYSVAIVVTQEKPDSNLYMVTVSINGVDDRSESTVKGLVEL
jgi:prepilin-type N-terminal cleavage/methylation domain-containing protein